MAPRLSLASCLLLAVAFAHAGVPSMCATLRGSVACLDCTPQHNLSGVVVAVKCSDGVGLHAGQTDGSGNFDVAMPVGRAAECAARVLGGVEPLCAPQGITVASVVAGGRPGTYALASPLAFFTRCNSGGAVATMAAGDQSPPVVTPRPGRPQRAPAPPVWTSPPRSGGVAPPYSLGIPLIYLFPFIPIIGIP